MVWVEKTVTDFLEELASASPAPGGGSVSALAGSLGTALISMVCHLTIGKKRYAEVEEDVKQILLKSEKLRDQLTGLVDKDTEAFNLVMNALSMPKETDEQKDARAQAAESATKQATMVPFLVMQMAEDAIEICDELAQKGNTNALSDAGVAALMIAASCRGAYYNVRINLASLKDSDFVEDIKTQSKNILDDVEFKARRIATFVESKF
jgi:formiminotetrahydrofolate cyclodeaminase